MQSFSGFPGSVDVHYCTIESTNTFVKRWLKDSCPPEGTIVRSDYQTGGRGRRGRAWRGASGESFLATMILYPHFLETSNHFYLSMAFAVAVYEMIEKFTGKDDKLQLKWPNDVLYGRKKLAGILPESAVQNSRFMWYIAGCGLNVNQEHPEVHDSNAISLKNITGRPAGLHEFAPLLKRTFSGYYEALRMNSFVELQERYLSIMYGRKEKASFYNSEGKTFEAKIVHVNSDGTLEISGEKGSINVDYSEWRIGL